MKHVQREVVYRNDWQVWRQHENTAFCFKVKYTLFDKFFTTYELYVCIIAYVRAQLYMAYYIMETFCKISINAEFL